MDKNMSLVVRIRWHSGKETIFRPTLASYSLEADNLYATRGELLAAHPGLPVPIRPQIWDLWDRKQRNIGILEEATAELIDRAEKSMMRSNIPNAEHRPSREEQSDVERRFSDAVRRSIRSSTDRQLLWALTVNDIVDVVSDMSLSELLDVLKQLERKDFPHLGERRDYQTPHEIKAESEAWWREREKSAGETETSAEWWRKHLLSSDDLPSGDEEL